MIVLPRQARDKHSSKTQNKGTLPCESRQQQQQQQQRRQRTAAAAVAAAAAAVASPRTPGGDDEAAGVGGRIGDNTTLLFLRPVVFLLVKAITLPRQARDKENT
jgi:hypothetical protein